MTEIMKYILIILWIIFYGCFIGLSMSFITNLLLFLRDHACKHLREFRKYILGYFGREMNIIFYCRAKSLWKTNFTTILTITRTLWAWRKNWKLKKDCGDILETIFSTFWYSIMTLNYDYFCKSVGSSNQTIRV